MASHESYNGVDRREEKRDSDGGSVATSVVPAQGGPDHRHHGAGRIVLDGVPIGMKLHYADLSDASSLRRWVDALLPDEVYNLAA
ncbi:hypothetical protein OPV22_028654 [Ensete ventricosum]|uniref:Uncharacterized protein n=1 Tax=Ensete ventricosum TaxID=4639 RepID=A0AAV8PYY9_ENSVE|nr:hypothetical protein OPV22_028654 [Ensete ventricosum]